VRQSERIPFARAKEMKEPNLVGMNAPNAVLYFPSHFTLKARMKRRALNLCTHLRAPSSPLALSLQKFILPLA
jgi:hypothetical protein